MKYSVVILSLVALSFSSFAKALPTKSHKKELNRVLRCARKLTKKRIMKRAPQQSVKKLYDILLSARNNVEDLSELKKIRKSCRKSYKVLKRSESYSDYIRIEELVPNADEKIADMVRNFVRPSFRCKGFNLVARAGAGAVVGAGIQARVCKSSNGSRFFVPGVVVTGGYGVGASIGLDPVSDYGLSNPALTAAGVLTVGIGPMFQTDMDTFEGGGVGFAAMATGQATAGLPIPLRTDYRSLRRQLLK